mmetsp:Transcript_14747/g.33377  ORF Transcript_14747/g.33377 Transcript_14747/m.33377 type:complete len:331 (-) Transcript_14747:85-1077(-)
MISSSSAFLIVFALPTSKSLVMAMALTTLKYFCRKAQNFRLLMPPFSMWRQTRRACSPLTSKPSREAKCEQRPSSGILSSAPLSSSKSLSKVMSRFRISLRRAPATWPYLASTMALHLLLTDSTWALDCAERVAVFDSILLRSFRASSKGPLLAVFSLGNDSLMTALVSAATSSVSFSPRSASSKMETGVAKLCTSALSRLVSGFTPSATFFARASKASIFAVASLVIAAASLRSRASMCALFSANSFLANSAFACVSFFLVASMAARLVETVVLHFASSARASAAEAALPPAFASSLSLVLRKTRACRTFLAPSSMHSSISLQNDMNWV